MIAFADSTEVVMVKEESWKTPPSGVEYAPLLLVSESLRPELRHLRPQRLSGVNESPAVLTEEMVSGDIEGVATVSLLKGLLPLILSEEIPTWSGTQTRAIIRQGAMRLPSSVPNTILPGDGVWLTPKNNSALTGFYPISKNGNLKVISGLESSLASSNIGMHFSGWAGGSASPSVSLMRRYGDEGSNWMHMAGMKLQRLTLDLQVESLMLATASMIGSHVTLNATAPRVQEYKSSAPLGFASGLKTFRLASATHEINANDAVITDFRIVLERIGMAPQFALGSTTPRLITPGKLGLYGHLDMLISDQQLFQWLSEDQELSVFLALEDGNSQGIAFALPKIKLSGVETTARTSEEPISARFTFHADAGSDGDVIRAFASPISS